MMGCSLTIPISAGRLNLGTWQVLLIVWYVFSELNDLRTLAHSKQVEGLGHSRQSGKMVTALNREVESALDNKLANFLLMFQILSS